MPFGESFISTLRSNKSIMLDKSRRFRKISGSFDWSKSHQFNFKKATPEQLEEISKRIKKENKQTRLRQLSVLVIIIIVIVPTFNYLLF